MICGVDGFELEPLYPIFGGNNGFTVSLLIMSFMYAKYMGFTFRGGIKEKLKPLMWLTVGVVLSYIPAYLYYGQPVYQSFLTYRRFFCYLAFPLLLSIRPSVDEIRRALYAFCVLYAVFAFTVTFLKPDWVILQEDVDLVREGDFIHVILGERLVLLALIFALDTLRVSRNRWSLIAVVLVFALLFIIQNRTALMSAFFIIILAVFFNRSAKVRLVASVLMLSFFVITAGLAMNYIDALIEETMEQLDDPDYNRVKAFMYFFSWDRPKLTYVLGNGFISGNVSPLMSRLQEEGIFHSDMGLIGMWNQFGIIPVITIYYIAFRGLGRNHSFIVRAFSLFVILSSLTLGYYMLLQTIFVLSMYLYLYSTDDHYVEAMKQQRQEMIAKLMRKYRSLAR